MEDVILADEVKYFTQVAHFRYAISCLMSNHLLINEVDISDGELTPYYGRTDKNFTKGIVVEFLNDVIPYCIYTPFGALEVNPHESKETLELTYQFLSDQQKDAFVRDFKQQFGAVVLQAYHASPKGNGSQAMIYQVTKLPTETVATREQCPELLSPTALSAQQVAEEQAHWQLVRNQVDCRLRITGHAEMTFTDARITKRKSLVTEIRPKLPKYLEDKNKDRA